MNKPGEKKPMEDEKEQRLTAEELTRQRRKEYGLEKSGELTPTEIEKTEIAIEELLERLNNYANLDPETQEEWYWVEKEATAG